MPHPPAPASPRRLEPELFGSLGPTPAVLTGVPDLFAGEEQYLRGAQRKQRATLWRAVAPALDRLLAADERVLYAAPAMERPTASQVLGLGWTAQYFHQVLLVFTDRRLVELLLDFRGKAPETRIRSVPWTHVRDLQLRLRSLTLHPVSGKGRGWSVRLRGDRKLLKLLLPRMRDRLRWEDATGDPGPVPLWHCPACSAVLPEHPTACGSCGTAFRSSRVASVLSLAFPGAGLFYAGRPVLGALDCVGELVAFVVFAVALAIEADQAAVYSLLGFGACVFVATKVESMHLGHLMLARTVPEPPGHRRRWSRFGVVGGAVSVLAFATAFSGMGRFAPRLERDLDFAAGAGWTGTRRAAEWQAFEDDPSMRSQWTNDDGLLVWVFAYPLGGGVSAQSIRAEVVGDAKQLGEKILVQDTAVPSPFGGYRFIREAVDPAGRPVEILDYFIQDDANGDVHQVLAVVDRADGERAEATLEQLIAHGRWIVARAPER